MEPRFTEKEFYNRHQEESTLYGIPWSRFKELIDLFAKDDYILEDEKDFEMIKRDYFNS